MRQLWDFNSEEGRLEGTSEIVQKNKILWEKLAVQSNGPCNFDCTFRWKYWLTILSIYSRFIFFSILLQCGLPQPTLAQIWQLADQDSDGRLSRAEFVAAMSLCDAASKGFINFILINRYNDQTFDLIPRWNSEKNEKIVYSLEKFSTHFCQRYTPTV